MLELQESIYKVLGLRKSLFNGHHFGDTVSLALPMVLGNLIAF